MSYRSIKYYSSAIATSTGVVINPIDISDYDKFSVIYQNNNTAVALTELIVQVASDASGTAADTPPNWVLLSTSTLLQPSALGATAASLTSSVDNTYHWLRVLAKVGTTATAGTLSVHISGFTGF